MKILASKQLTNVKVEKADKQLASAGPTHCEARHCNINHCK